METAIEDFLKGVDVNKDGIYSPQTKLSGKGLSRVLLQRVIDDHVKLVGVTILNGGKVLGDTLTSLKSVPRGLLEIEISKITLEPGLKNFELPSPLEGNILLMDDIIETGSTAIMAIRYLISLTKGYFGS